MSERQRERETWFCRLMELLLGLVCLFHYNAYVFPLLAYRARARDVLQYLVPAAWLLRQYIVSSCNFSIPSLSITHYFPYFPSSCYFSLYLWDVVSSIIFTFSALFRFACSNMPMFSRSQNTRTITEAKQQ